MGHDALDAAPVQREPESLPYLRFLADYAADAALPAPRNLAGAVLLVALLGGYQHRKHDPPPGHQIMWRGYERMSIATLGYRVAEKRGRAGVVRDE